MPAALLPTQQLVERLGREEQQLRKLGLHAQAAGIRTAITVLLRMADEPAQQQSLDPST
jgi:hypothetical protein